jgi:hypothetical protein
MIKMSQLLELPTVYEALPQSPKLPLRAFPFFSYPRANRKIIREIKSKDNPYSFWRASVGQKS